MRSVGSARVPKREHGGRHLFGGKRGPGEPDSRSAALVHAGDADSGSYPAAERQSRARALELRGRAAAESGKRIRRAARRAGAGAFPSPPLIFEGPAPSWAVRAHLTSRTKRGSYSFRVPAGSSSGFRRDVRREMRDQVIEHQPHATRRLQVSVHDHPHVEREGDRTGHQRD